MTDASDNGHWRSYKLDELGFVGRGRSRHRPRNEPSLYGGAYPFFQTGEIKAAELYLRKSEQTYSAAGLAQSKLWEPGTLCITIAANIADTAILGVRGCFPDSVVGFIADETKADVRFIKYSFDVLQRSMQNVSHGTTQDNFSLDKMLKFDFLVPKVGEQKKIAMVLGAYDELIENNRRRIELLEDMARRIYREWFVEFRFPGHSHSFLSGSSQASIPIGWEQKTLREICSQVDYGYTEKATQEPVGPKFLRITDIVPPLIDWDRVPYCTIPDDKRGRFLLADGDIVIARTGATVGYAKRIDAMSPAAVFASYLVRLRVKPEFDNNYVGLVVESDEYKRFVNANMGGAAQPNANAQVLASFPIVVPTAVIRDKFRRIIGDVFVQRAVLRSKIGNLQKTRDLLLPRLISGELDVSELPIEVKATEEE